MNFLVHSPETAPEGSKPTLKKIKGTYGFIPNLAGVFAESPGTLNFLGAAMAAFDAQEMSLTPIERQVVLLAVSVSNRCEYCTAAHSMLASMAGLSRENIDALQDGESLSDSKLEALRQLAEHIVEARGWVEPAIMDRFMSAGYGNAQILEVIAGAALKTLTNYTNHIAKPAVNEQFAAFLPRWKKEM